MQSRYQVKFELQLNSATSRNNYEYLDILDRAWAKSARSRPTGLVLCDIGCASFWYAATLQAFFLPSRLVGVEVEGHRLFKDGHTRIDYVSGYLAEFAHAEFVVADYRHYELRTEVVTAWFPFVSATAILAWRLPLSLLAPRQLFARCYQNLCSGGLLVMVNHGNDEADVAGRFCVAAGFRLLFRTDEGGLLSGHRLNPAVLSCWTRP